MLQESLLNLRQRVEALFRDKGYKEACINHLLSYASTVFSMSSPRKGVGILGRQGQGVSTISRDMNISRPAFGCIGTFL